MSKDLDFAANSDHYQGGLQCILVGMVVKEFCGLRCEWESFENRGFADTTNAQPVQVVTKIILRKLRPHILRLKILKGRPASGICPYQFDLFFILTNLYNPREYGGFSSILEVFLADCFYALRLIAPHTNYT